MIVKCLVIFKHKWLVEKSNLIVPEKGTSLKSVGRRPLVNPLIPSDPLILLSALTIPLYSMEPASHLQVVN